MSVSTADAQRAADRWAEIAAEGNLPSHLPGYVARKVVGEDLRASGVLAADEQWPVGMWQQLCDELLPRDGRLMGTWGAEQWRPVLARARELSGGRVL